MSEYVAGRDERERRIVGDLETLLGLNLLQYHDRNHLAHGASPKALSVTERELIERALGDVRALRDSA